MPMPILLAALLAAAPAVPVPLTLAVDAYPSLSPDGATLLFQSNRGGRWALYFADADGRNPRVFLDSGDDPSVASWSPDGARIVFAATVGEAPEIFVIDRDGSNRRRLTDDPGGDSHPHWSPDGTRIYFNSARGTPDRSAEWSRQWHDVYSVALDGSALRRHTRCEAVCTYPAPSPDGKRLAYRKVVAAPAFDWGLRATERNSEVFVANLDGSDARNLSRHAAYDGWPRWSPDGRWVVVSSNRTGRPNAGQLFALAADGDAVLQLTDGAEAFVQHSIAGPDAILAARVVDSVDPPFEHGHIVRLEVQWPPPE
ncbi:MAG TPA: hypothetical protein VFO79_14465 [Xanthomonadales bacterium]|nr:hypothetical protein [Xanthomonadales bacterium]